MHEKAQGSVPVTQLSTLTTIIYRNKDFNRIDAIICANEQAFDNHWITLNSLKNYEIITVTQASVYVR